MSTPGVLDAHLHLLDRQVVDVHEHPVCNVDDLELSEVDGQLVVTAILVGPGALGPRLGGLLGRVLVAIHRRVGGLTDPAPPRIPFELVEEIGSSVRLVLPASELNVTPLEDWVCEHVIRHIPGAGHAHD